MTKITAQQFKQQWEQAGNKTNSKGRPVLPEDAFNLTLRQQTSATTPTSKKKQSPTPFGNKKVKNAQKQYDEHGELTADSKWELQCLRMLQLAGLQPEEQRKFTILPMIRQQGFRTLPTRGWKPDFTFEDLKIVADAKGWITEMARIKMHLFLDKYPGWRVYELKKQKDVLDLIQIIKEERNG